MNEKHYYFISGLPRSGSTLLSAILRQNPKFYADIASPLRGMLETSINHMSQCEATQTIDIQQRENVLSSIVDGYYKKIQKEVIFDSCRGWTGNSSLLKNLFPYTKIICCVRDVTWVLDSFEKLSNNNPYYSNLFSDQETHHCVETRCESLMDVLKGGQVIKPWFWLKEGLTANPKMIMLIEYNDLCKYPQKIIEELYDFIKQPYFKHDFTNVEYSNDLFDLSISSPNLHKVSGKVEFKQRDYIIPDSVVEKYSNMEFWRNKKTSFGYE